MKKKNDLNKSLRQSMIKPIGDIGLDLGEILLDSEVTDEVLKQIPILKNVYALGKAGMAIQNIFLLKKIYRFLKELDSISEEEKEEFLNDLESKYSEKYIYEKLLIIIDRLDEEQKATIMGKLFKALIKGDIDEDTCFRLFNVLDKAYYGDLLIFYMYNQKASDRSNEYVVKYDNLVKSSLAQIGILAPKYEENKRMQQDYSARPKIGISGYHITKLGRDLLDYGF